MKYIADNELITFNREDLDSVLERFANIVIEKTLCSIPDMLTHIAKRTTMMRELYVQLFKDCPECQDDKELLASVIQKLEVENPGKSPTEVFALVPDAYRKAKGLINSLENKPFDPSAINSRINGVL